MKARLRRRNLLSVLEETAITVPDELGRVFREHSGLVFRTAYRITGNAGDAEDVLQTIFLRVLRRDATSPDAMHHPESYLRRAAIHGALDVVRARRAEQTVALPEEYLELPQANAAPGEGLALRQALAQAMAGLKPRAAEIFALRFLEGLSNQQIAKTLGVSQVLVAVIVHRTRQQLRRELRPYLSGNVPVKPNRRQNQQASGERS